MGAVIKWIIFLSFVFLGYLAVHEYNDAKEEKLRKEREPDFVISLFDSGDARACSVKCCGDRGDWNDRGQISGCQNQVDYHARWHTPYSPEYPRIHVVVSELGVFKIAGRQVWQCEGIVDETLCDERLTSRKYLVVQMHDRNQPWQIAAVIYGLREQRR